MLIRRSTECEITGLKAGAVVIRPTIVNPSAEFYAIPAWRMSRKTA